MEIKTWEFGYLVESNYRMVEDWLFAVEWHGVSEGIPTEIRAAKDLTNAFQKLEY